MKLKTIENYQIYTDASFEDVSKLATYSVVITSEGKILEVFSKRCKLDAQKSTEVEIFGIYQAMSLILMKYLNQNKYQTFQMVKRNMQIAKMNGEKNEIVVIEKRHLVNIMNELSKNQRKILCCLMEMPKENGMLEFDREKIATKLNLSICTVTRAIAVFRRLNIIGIKHKESYEMLI